MLQKILSSDPNSIFFIFKEVTFQSTGCSRGQSGNGILYKIAYSKDQAMRIINDIKKSPQQKVINYQKEGLISLVNRSSNDYLYLTNKKLIKLDYLDAFNTKGIYLHNEKLNVAVLAFLSDEGLCSYNSNNSGKLLNQTGVVGCNYYYNGVFWSPVDIKKIIESEKLQKLLDNAILRIK